MLDWNILKQLIMNAVLTGLCNHLNSNGNLYYRLDLYLEKTKEIFSTARKNILELPGDLKTRKSSGTSCEIKIHFFVSNY